jgi:hypothetical protein
MSDGFSAESEVAQRRMTGSTVLSEEAAEQAVSPDVGTRSLRSLDPPQLNGKR